MELKLIDIEDFDFQSDEHSNLTREHYEIGDYSVVVDIYESGYKNILARPTNSNEYLPEVYGRYSMDKNDWYSKLYGFEIKAKHGSWTIDETKEAIKGLEQAIKVVEILTEKFIK